MQRCANPCCGRLIGQAKSYIRVQLSEGLFRYWCCQPCFDEYHRTIDKLEQAANPFGERQKRKPRREQHVWESGAAQAALSLGLTGFDNLYFDIYSLTIRQHKRKYCCKDRCKKHTKSDTEHRSILIRKIKLHLCCKPVKHKSIVRLVAVLWRKFLVT